MLSGGIEILALMVDRFGLDDQAWRAIAALNDVRARLGFVVVGVFTLCCVMSAVQYRRRRYGGSARSASE